ncbi:Gp138 family membrane-puncturing spike protein [Robbsia andropogonis]|uniref:Gp138 family membrane-puncturing spike protein n=1 Tax=Robbsia andropogonis TaxID=28092 RepID=UPI0004652446|nr:Gp138 family membrane-puncturing spike protein [Robbsia andropogonis]
MEQQERLGSLDVVLRSATRYERSNLWTALPAIIQSFDASAITCTAQPSVQVESTAQDGSTTWASLPLLVDVPVCFPRGGGCTLTFPVSQGDEVLIVFASRCIDAWWQSGGVQQQAELRMHDLSDGFAIPGPFSQATKISGVSLTSTQLRSNSGSAYIDLNPSTNAVKIVAPGGFSVEAPLSTFSAAVTVNGVLTFVAGLVGSAASGAAATISGVINFVGQVFANGKRIDDSHTHGGVQSGSSNTNSVN